MTVKQFLLTVLAAVFGTVLGALGWMWAIDRSNQW